MPTSKDQEIFARVSQSLARIEKQIEARALLTQVQAELKKLGRNIEDAGIKSLYAEKRQLEKRLLEQYWEANHILYLPEGVHAMCSVDGVGFNLLVDKGSASAMEVQRLTLIGRGLRPYLDFDHEDGAVSFWPNGFVWHDGPRPGVYAKGAFSEAGLRDVVQRKRYLSFSPCLQVDNRYTPAVVSCATTLLRKGNLGGFTNRALLRGIKLHGF